MRKCVSYCTADVFGNSNKPPLIREDTFAVVVVVIVTIVSGMSVWWF